MKEDSTQEQKVEDRSTSESATQPTSKEANPIDGLKPEPDEPVEPAVEPQAPEDRIKQSEADAPSANAGKLATESVSEPSTDLQASTPNESTPSVEWMREQIASHNWGEELSGKTVNFYSGKYNIEANQLNETYVGQLEAKDDSIHSGQVAELAANENPDSMTIHDTQIGQLLDMMESEKWFNKETRDSLWSSASERLAQAAREEPASVGWVSQANPDRTYAQKEHPALMNNPDHIHITDEVAVDGKPGAREQIPDRYLDKDGNWLVQ